MSTQLESRPKTSPTPEQSKATAEVIEPKAKTEPRAKDVSAVKGYAMHIGAILLMLGIVLLGLAIMQ